MSAFGGKADIGFARNIEEKGGPFLLWYSCGRGQSLGGRFLQQDAHGELTRLPKNEQTELIQSVRSSRRQRSETKTRSRSSLLSLRGGGEANEIIRTRVKCLTMPDSLGFRKRIGIVVPSTNTTVQPECENLRPHGVTNHVARSTIKEPTAEYGARLFRTHAGYARGNRNCD
jgi:hypothetical protein